MHWEYCQPNGQPNAAYTSLLPDYPGFEANIVVAERFVSYGLCGTSAWGITSEYSPLLEGLSKLVDYESDNDAMVAVPSCTLSSKPYGSTYDRQFLKTDINHVDGTGRTGSLHKSVVRQWIYNIAN